MPCGTCGKYVMIGGHAAVPLLLLLLCYTYAAIDDTSYFGEFFGGAEEYLASGYTEALLFNLVPIPLCISQL